MPTPATRPSYLGLLNALSLGESGNGVYLTAWADVPDDEDLAGTLRMVAAREISHGEAFARRLRRGLMASGADRPVPEFVLPPAGERLSSPGTKLHPARWISR